MGRGNFQEKLTGNLEIVKFPKSEPFNRILQKFQNENQMEQKFPNILSKIWVYTSGGSPLFRKSQVSCFDRVIATHAPSRNWTVLDDSENIGTQVGKKFNVTKKILMSL